MSRPGTNAADGADMKSISRTLGLSSLFILGCGSEPSAEGEGDRGTYQAGGKADEFASCAGACDGQSKDGCWCDAECDAFGDCCPDKVDVCDGTGSACGPATCAADEVCCNESCGVCTPAGGFCTQQVCEDPEELGQECGPSRCAAGEVCCNESCGICTQPGDFCTQEVCVDPDPDGSVPCGDAQCADGLVCCNASCGICTEPGGACIQVVCE